MGILYQILYRECLKHTDREGSNIMSNTPAWHLVHISNPPSADVVLADGSTIGHLVQTFEGNGWAAVSSTGRRLGRSDNITRAAVLVVDAHRAGGRA